MSDEVMDVSADSSSASVETADPSQATTQPAQPAVQPKGFHEHPDWQRMVASRREDRATIQQLQQTLQAMQQQMRQPQSQDGPLTQEEQQAIAVLKKLMGRDPELAAALMASKRLPQYDKQFEGVTLMQQQAAQAHYHASRAAIREMAKTEGLPTDDKSLVNIVRLVAGAAMAMENGEERFKSGDMNILQEAFDSIKDFLGAMRKPAQDSLVSTKNKVKQLPKPPVGGAAGAPAMPKPQPGKEREYEQSLHSMARKMLLEG